MTSFFFFWIHFANWNFQLESKSLDFENFSLLKTIKFKISNIFPTLETKKKKNKSIRNFFVCFLHNEFFLSENKIGLAKCVSDKCTCTAPFTFSDSTKACACASPAVLTWISQGATCLVSGSTCFSNDQCQWPKVCTGAGSFPTNPGTCVAGIFVFRKKKNSVLFE